jgi:hypothetical protein
MKYIRFGITPTADKEKVMKAYEPIHKEVNSGLSRVVQKGKSYGHAVDSIFLIPEIVPRDHVNQKGHSLRKFDSKIRAASYRFPIDLERFLEGDRNARIELITDNINASIKDLQKRKTADFDADALIKDIEEEPSKLKS